MDDMQISLSVPATIYSFGETERPLTLNKYVTHAKLKAFYVGRTPDNRVFTKQFSDQLLLSLPGTPVVAYYSEETKDFIGHNSTQYVFGYVPETATIEYRNEDGAQYAITDVLLFTGRNDNIGEIANKIIGKPHSLELDPASIEYEIVRANGKIDSITFRKGSFIGLSVLGTNEKPAFTGSQFFTEGSDLQVFVDSFQEFKSEVESYKSGGQRMNEEKDMLPTVEDTVIEAIENNLSNPETSFVDNNPVIIGEDREPGMDPYADVAADPSLAPDVVIEQGAPMEDNTWEEKPVLEEPIAEEPITEDPPVGPEVVVEVAVENPEKEEEEEEEEDDDLEDTGELAISDIPIAVEEPKVVLEEVSIEPMSYAEEAPLIVVSKEEVDVKQPKKETWEPEKISHTAALDEAERQELNSYRKAAKFELIDSYSALSEEVKNKFKADYEKFSLKELDKELAYELVQSQRQMKQSEIKMFSMPTIMPEAPKTKQDAIKELVERYKDRK